jgi:flagellin-like hook-associated protein FlgL
MSLVNKENLLAAQHMYLNRIKTLQREVNRVVDKGLQLGEANAQTTMSALDEIEKELEGIDECLTVLKHLFRS